MPLPEDIKGENRSIRTFRILTDLTFQRLCIERMTLVEALECVVDLRRAAAAMFPGKEGTFDLLIAPRLERVINERFGEGTACSRH